MGLSENGEVFKYIANITFSKFVDKVISQGESYYGLNEHWAPSHLHCNFCQINYDVIGRIEEFENYLSYILEVTKLRHQIPKGISNYHLHPSGMHTVSSTEQENRADKISKYFATLSDIQIMKLYKIYEIDFELFGYDKNEFSR